MKLTSTHYLHGLLRLLTETGCEVDVRLKGGEEYYCATGPFGILAIKCPAKRFGNYQHSDLAIPGDAEGTDAQRRLENWLDTGAHAEAVDPNRNIIFGRHCTEYEFRQDERKCDWWRNAVRHPVGQDVFSALQELDPATRLGDSAGASHRSDLTQMQVTKDNESRIIGKIEMFQAVWRLLTRKLTDPIQNQQRSTPRRGSAQPLHSHHV